MVDAQPLLATLLHLPFIPDLAISAWQVQIYLLQMHKTII